MKKSAPKRSRSNRWSEGFRQPRDGELYISGLNGVHECLASPHVTVRKIWLDKRKQPSGWQAVLTPYRDIIVDLEQHDTPYGPATQGVAALVDSPVHTDLYRFVEEMKPRGQQPLLVALDQIEDPMNLGQILRTCEGAGVDGVVLLRHRSVHLNQTVAQISQGAFAWVGVVEVTNLRSSLEDLKQRGYWSIGCEGGKEAVSWCRVDLTGPTVLVFGAEGRGLRALTRKTCDTLASLPMKGHINSLNVGAAVSAFLYEAVRQREMGNPS